MDRFKKLCYGNQNKDFFEKHRSFIDEQNVHIISIMLQVMPLLVLMYLLNDAFFMYKENVRLELICVAFFVFFNLEILFWRKYSFFAHKYATFCCYFIGEGVFLFLLFIGPIFDSGNMAVFLPAISIVLYLLVIMPMHKLVITSAVHFVIIAVVDFCFKSTDLVISDMINILLCNIAGFLIGSNVLKSRLSEIASFDTLKETSEVQIAKAHELAMKDELTGVGNRRAYAIMEESLNEKIQARIEPAFGVIVCDVNQLKKTNDLKGHEYGDFLIKRCSGKICRVFSHSPVYRYGGDEFVIILCGEDFDNREQLLAQLQESSDFSSGLSVYDPSSDESVLEVFRRADYAMYEHKQKTREV